MGVVHSWPLLPFVTKNEGGVRLSWCAIKCATILHISTQRSVFSSFCDSCFQSFFSGWDVLSHLTYAYGHLVCERVRCSLACQRDGGCWSYGLSVKGTKDKFKRPEGL